MMLNCKPGQYQSMLDEAQGSFSFISRGARLTHDFRKLYNKLILSHEWSA